LAESGLLALAAADSLGWDPGMTRGSRVDLYWLPLGAGGHVVRWNGRAYEAWAARRARRPRQALFHSALDVTAGGERHVIEMAPTWSGPREHGAVSTGPVGLVWLGRSRWFTYDVRCWRDGVIPDLAEAVASPRRLSEDGRRARRLLQLTAWVPSLTWGRDELGTGDMWNSNSIVAWLLVRSGHDVSAVAPPGNGRAPGWAAGLELAARQTRGATAFAEGDR
jgi:hypothetical protein